MGASGDVVRQAYDVFGRGEIDQFIKLLDDSVEWNIPAELPYGGIYRSPEAVVEMMSTISNYYLTRNLEITSFDELDDLVVVRGRHFGKVTDGRDYDAGFAAFFTVHAGRIATMREYVDPGKVILVLDSLKTENAGR
ncbi:hypothetical protein ALI144C_19340 [Actinosynnema sp. ALI-1.44]|nr:hypothetical protein ALI144C_19340 [Actinosynnema sp. ALI-1.44]